MEIKFSIIDFFPDLKEMEKIHKNIDLIILFKNEIIFNNKLKKNSENTIKINDLFDKNLELLLKNKKNEIIGEGKIDFNKYVIKNQNKIFSLWISFENKLIKNIYDNIKLKFYFKIIFPNNNNNNNNNIFNNNFNNNIKNKKNSPSNKNIKLTPTSKKVNNFINYNNNNNNYNSNKLIPKYKSFSKNKRKMNNLNNNNNTIYKHYLNKSNDFSNIKINNNNSNNKLNRSVQKLSMLDKENKIFNKEFENFINKNEKLINPNLNSYKTNNNISKKLLKEKFLSDNNIINVQIKNSNSKNNNNNIKNKKSISNNNLTKINKKKIITNFSIIKSDSIKNLNKENNLIQIENKNDENDYLKNNEFFYLKSDFEIFYTDSYLNEIKEEDLNLEYELCLDKTLELIQTYHKILKEIEKKNKYYKIILNNYFNKKNIFEKKCFKLKILKKNFEKKILINNNKNDFLDKKLFLYKNDKKIELSLLKKIIPKNKFQFLKQMFTIIITKKKNIIKDFDLNSEQKFFITKNFWGFYNIFKKRSKSNNFSGYNNKNFNFNTFNNNNNIYNNLINNNIMNNVNDLINNNNNNTVIINNNNNISFSNNNININNNKNDNNNNNKDDNFNSKRNSLINLKTNLINSNYDDNDINLIKKSLTNFESFS